MLKRFFTKKKETQASANEIARESTRASGGAQRENATQNKRKGSPKPKGRAKKSVAAKAEPVWQPADFEVPVVEGKTRFHDLNLEPSLLHGIADLGFEYCSPIQAESLPFALQGNDVVGKAQTGTGKTAAFLVAIINDLLRNPITEGRYAGEARSLVIAPTRELVMQIADDAKALTKHTGLKVHTLVGGMDYDKQLRQIEREYIDILVATPGRLLDFVSNRHCYLDECELLVIDEADRMLDMGFIPQVRRIIQASPRKENRQTLMFSATFTDDVNNLASQWTIDPHKVEIEPESVATDSVEQKVYMCSADEKFDVLYNVVRLPEVENVIVFANRRDTTHRLYDRLKAHGFKVGILSGDVAQARRVKTLEQFKNGQINIMVATDVAGRGIHVDGITHVINYTLPEEAEDYVHRIGRTGRAGSKGTSISFACEDDAFLLPNIEALLGDSLKCEQPPEALMTTAPYVKVESKSQPPRRNAGRRHPSGRR
ncbi:ATP-dependent RNA helicase RhlB [Umboniibacter marinipuniceus]|uniref:ATP-dependent RNA helicase RhlB n=1 Tax=Umboniibacter marinipuniceus TaxID=569599 RepID=A0A3M0AC07_9GAMM|nr:ATP-dependent RNA helicase RhlB [Umboniibacter marinipuniceus]RMA79955.1 ATP-dependent RNA helicase RhlB [Umboniibacter marinipuniceus]